eukprot:498767-Amorphochlora_amoeboformis.AAC.1
MLGRRGRRDPCSLDGSPPGWPVRCGGMLRVKRCSWDPRRTRWQVGCRHGVVSCGNLMGRGAHRMSS